MTKKPLTSFIALLLVLSLFGCSKETSSLSIINNADWSNVKEVKLYTYLYHELGLNSDIKIINDENVINDLVKLMSNMNDLERVPKEKLSEGLPEWYIEFDNDVIIGLYLDEDYTTIFGTTDPSETCYVPKELREKVVDVLDQFLPV